MRRTIVNGPYRRRLDPSPQRESYFIAPGNLKSIVKANLPDRFTRGKIAKYSLPKKRTRLDYRAARRRVRS